jgi:uncharacterized protein YjbJ (UPF0337 family)
MKSIKQIRRFSVTIVLTAMLVITIAFDFVTANSWATTYATSSISSSDHKLIAMWGKATAKDIEGKAQETLGNMTGDPKNQIMGKAKQVEGNALKTAENVKDTMKLKGRTKAISKNIEGKTQEAIGKMTDNPKDQIIGKAKQVESQGRNIVEDMKDKVQDVFQ